MVCITSRLHSTEFELRFCAGSNPALGVSEVCHVENFQLMPRMSEMPQMFVLRQPASYLTIVRNLS